MALWIQSRRLGRVEIPTGRTILESSVGQKGKNGCRYVRIDSCDNVHIKKMFDSNRSVPDVERYHICKSGRALCLLSYYSNALHPRNRYNDHLCRQQFQGDTVVLLLESPHKDEYDNCGRPIAPAQGRTGKNICKHLDKVLGEILRSDIRQIQNGCNTRLILCNPVQFQTSLHMILDGKLRPTWRDKVWLALWDDPCIKQCFKGRMEMYNPNLVINACTGERTDPNQSNMNSLKRKVNEFLLNCTSIGNVYETGHPSGWYSPNNRAVTKVHSGIF